MPTCMTVWAAKNPAVMVVSSLRIALGVSGMIPIWLEYAAVGCSITVGLYGGWALVTDPVSKPLLNQRFA